MVNHSLPEYVIVTGAGRGIGKAVALSLAAEKCKILCLSKTVSCQTTADEIIANGGQASALVLDISEYDLAQSKVLSWISEKKCSRIGVVAAAGILGPAGSLTQTSLLDWEKALKVNLLGNLAIVKATLPTMEQAQYGRLVMFAGGGAAYANPTFPAYACSKAAVVRAVENIAEDLQGKDDIAITCIAPGAIETDMLTVVRQHGGEVRSPGQMSDVIVCVKALLGQRAKILSGCFVHVRDNWAAQLEGQAPTLSKDHWKLRRVQ